MNLVLTDNSILVFDGREIFYAIDQEGSFWFKGQEIAEILNYQFIRKAINEFVPEECKSEHASLLQRVGLDSGSIANQLNPETIFVNEEGLCRLVSSSILPEATRCQAWVFGEVLPAIRKAREHRLGERYTQMIDSLNQSNATLCQANERLNLSNTDLHQELQDIRPHTVVSTEDVHKRPEFHLIRKNDDSPHPYYAMRVQRRGVQSRLKKIRETFPGMTLVHSITDNPNTVNLHHRIKESGQRFGHIVCHGNHIRTNCSEEALIEEIIRIDKERLP